MTTSVICWTMRSRSDSNAAVVSRLFPSKQCLIFKTFTDDAVKPLSTKREQNKVSLEDKFVLLALKDEYWAGNAYR